MQTLIVDNGSFKIKLGYSNSELPLDFPTLLGKPKQIYNWQGYGDKGDYVGEDAANKGGIIQARYPMEYGIITDWDDMTRIWNYGFNKFNGSREDELILMSENCGVPKSHREKMTQIMFEDFNFGGMYVALQGVLALYGSGNTTGVVLDGGESCTRAIPIYEGHALHNSVLELKFVSRDVIVDNMVELFKSRNYEFRTTSEKRIVREIKELFGYVALNYEEELKLSEESILIDYELPDGTIINIGKERFKSTEVLFSPNIFGMEEAGVAEIVFNSIGKSDLDMRREFFSNIVLAGGTTMFRGFAERMHKELSELAPTMKIHVKDLPNRNYLTWKGGCIFASLSNFNNMCIKREEYEESGPTIVHRRCC
ncbi:hypothetical protein NAEGRDRAFT_72728 [Naegleria gruberi]|uniref:Actin n=1 Tax=Naegleria gruberi TaxID=5762 RepID=D2VUN6_NAEGR|nr:uncharacterized protein NAEGRDRAFT_72728 [Naegleria gruberi]EFC39540.1 hypothetical protein NAEGRDRAFT_72728 [Naegleria gruberi]|eukprot:XP_002672284.1 hypothetical protein NAEGRDRAFT_72728 [Naegleria gruberi strain NEG-M]